MKFIIYKDQKKITVENVAIPDQDLLNDIIEGSETKDISFNDLELYNLQITATRGIEFDEEEYKNNAELIKEINEGISWSQQTVN